VCENDRFADPSAALEAFYRDLLYELGEFSRRPTATALGAAVVAKRVAKQYGIGAADRLPLPRLSRAEREDRKEQSWRGYA
jgi:hypothetical protein